MKTHTAHIHGTGQYVTYTETATHEGYHVRITIQPSRAGGPEATADVLGADKQWHELTRLPTPITDRLAGYRAKRPTAIDFESDRNTLARETARLLNPVE